MWKARVVAVGVLSLSLASCARTYRMYEGPARAKTEVALLIRAPESHAQLRTVNGKRWPAWVRQFELPPGSYGVLLGFEKQIVTYGYNVTYVQRLYSNEDVQVGFQAEPGHRYTVYTEVAKGNEANLQRSHTLPDSWYKMLPTGKNIGMWRAVVCDLDTGEVVSQTDTVLIGARDEATARGLDAEMSRGVALWERNRREEALAVFTRVTERDPGHAPAWYARGLALAHLRRTEDARASLERALALNPHRDCYWYDQGVVLNDLGRQQEALTCLDRCLQLNPRYERGWVVKANVLMMLERGQDALRCAERAVELNPGNRDTWIAKARILVQLGRGDEAEAAFDRAGQD